MTRIWLSLCAVAALSACAPKVPPAQGVGFGDYESYEYSASRARRAQLETPLELRPENSGAPAATGHSHGPALSASELQAAGIDISSSVKVRTPDGRVLYGPADGQTPIDSVPKVVDPVPPGEVISTSNVNPAPVGATTLTAGGTTGPAPLSALRPGIVPGTETAAAAPAPAQRYTQVQAPATERPSGTGADVVAYALSTTHPVGAKQFNRTFASEAKARRACARYNGTDLAQRAFLEAGGPQRDRLGLDPDGDGFACGWTPEPFRSARAG